MLLSAIILQFNFSDGLTELHWLQWLTSESRFLLSSIQSWDMGCEMAFYMGVEEPSPS